MKRKPNFAILTVCRAETGVSYCADRILIGRVVRIKCVVEFCEIWVPGFDGLICRPQLPHIKISVDIPCPMAGSTDMAATISINREVAEMVPNDSRPSESNAPEKLIPLYVGSSLEARQFN